MRFVAPLAAPLTHSQVALFKDMPLPPNNLDEGGSATALSNHTEALNPKP